MAKGHEEALALIKHRRRTRSINDGFDSLLTDIQATVERHLDHAKQLQESMQPAGPPCPSDERAVQGRRPPPTPPPPTRPAGRPTVPDPLDPTRVPDPTRMPPDPTRTPDPTRHPGPTRTPTPNPAPAPTPVPLRARDRLDATATAEAPAPEQPAPGAWRLGVHGSRAAGRLPSSASRRRSASRGARAGLRAMACL